MKDPFIRRRVGAPLLGFLRQGMSPERLALCLALGVVIGNIPILGLSSILCALIALAARLNLPAMQLIQWLMTPTQLLLIIPYVRLGEWLSGAPRQPLSLEGVLALLANGARSAMHPLWDALLHATLAFLLVAPAAILILYGVLVPLLRQAARGLTRLPVAEPAL